MALTDNLTGLGNRRRLDMALSQEISRARRQGSSLGLIMLDVDYFKRFNDLYGHADGDVCLYRVAQAIQATLKRPADLAARYGGEEFTVLLPDTDSRGASQIANDILEAIRALNLEHADHPAGKVTASAGVAVGSPAVDDTTALGILKSADAYLYVAKNTGRDRWYSDTATKGVECPATSTIAKV